MAGEEGSFLSHWGLQGTTGFLFGRRLPQSTLKSDDSAGEGASQSQNMCFGYGIGTNARLIAPGAPKGLHSGWR